MRFLFTLAALSFATQLAAQTPDPDCRYGDRAEWELISPNYVGAWQILHHAGFVVMGSMTLPFPGAGDVETMEITMRDNGGLMATHPDMQAPLMFEWADEPALTFADEAAEDGVPGPILSSEDIELKSGCKTDDLARLIGTTKATIDGVTMDMTMRLMIVGADQLYGIFHVSSVVQGQLINMWRSVTIQR